MDRAFTQNPVRWTSGPVPRAGGRRPRGGRRNRPGQGIAFTGSHRFRGWPTCQPARSIDSLVRVSRRAARGTADQRGSPRLRRRLLSALGTSREAGGQRAAATNRVVQPPRAPPNPEPSSWAPATGVVRRRASGKGFEQHAAPVSWGVQQTGLAPQRSHTLTFCLSLRRGTSGEPLAVEPRARAG